MRPCNCCLFRNPIFTNQNDRDNDGVIDSLDADPDDPESNSDGDELSDLLELQSGLNPLSSDSDGDGILDHNDDENDTYESENKVYEIDSLYGNPNASFDLKVYELTYFLNSLDPAKTLSQLKFIIQMKITSKRVSIIRSYTTRQLL